MSIGPDLSYFTVMDIVFKLQGDHQSLQATALPLIQHPRLQKSWSISRKFSGAYWYGFEWSPDSRYLAFTDLEDETEYLTMVFTCIYEVQLVQGNLTLKLVNSDFRAAGWAGRICNLQFHPTMSYLIFRLSQKIFIWAFTQSKNPIASLNIYLLCIEDSSPELLYELASANNIPEIQFSSCGTSLSLLYSNRRWPALVCLPEKYQNYSVGAKRQRTDEGPSHVQKKPRASNELSSLRSDILAGFSCIKQSQALIKQSRDLETSVTLARSDSSTNQLQLLHSDGNEETTLQIASLPNTVPLRNSSVTFTISPVVDGGKPSLVRTIVTTRPQPTYDSTESRHMKELPLVIRKHCNAIPVSQASLQIEGLYNKDTLENIK